MAQDFNNIDDILNQEAVQGFGKKTNNKVSITKVVEPKQDATTSIVQDSKENILLKIEERFKEVSDLEGDLNCYYLTKENHLQVKTNKEKSDKHGEVFTPLWLVDKMLDQFKLSDWRRHNLTTFDLCSGYGQFTIRMLRRRYLYLQESGKSLNIPEVLSEYHLFAEIQPGSCFRLLYIFGNKIRLLIGDVSEMGSLPDNAEHGIWVYNKGRWEDRTEIVLTLFNKYNKKEFGSVSDRADAFERKFNSL